MNSRKKSSKDEQEALENYSLRRYDNAKPSILIGMQHWQLAIPLKVEEGEAFRTRLGWVVGMGCHSKFNECYFHSNEDEADEKLLR